MNAGGVYAISAVVDSFSDQLVEKGTIEEQNSNIADWNEHKAASRLPGLKFLRTLWLCAITGGPFEYTGLPLDDAHSDLRMSSSDFDQVSAVLADTLENFNVPPREKEEVWAPSRRTSLRSRLVLARSPEHEEPVASVSALSARLRRSESSASSITVESTEDGAGPGTFYPGVRRVQSLRDSA